MGRESKPYSDKSAPYATMGDSPDDYLYKKGKKQKLVGSADNSPEDGEEELEESGYRYERDEEIEFDGNNSKIWHYLITPDGERFTINHSPYQEISPEEFDKYVEEFRRSSLKENDMTDELNRFRLLAGLPIVEDCDESEDATKNDDGECSPFTHADENVEMVREFEDDYEDDFEPATNMCPECEGSGQNRMSQDSAFPGQSYDCERCNGEGEIFEGDVDEDFLAPPKDGYDTDERDAPELDRQTDYNAPPRDDGDDSYDMFDDSPLEEAPSRQDFRMVANLISKIEDPALRQSSAEDHADMFALQNPRFNKELFMKAAGADFVAEQGPGDDEFDHDEDAMVDLGDDDDIYGNDDEDLSGYGGEFYSDSQFYEMNELRKAAGIEQVTEVRDSAFISMDKWYEADPADLMTQIYWQKSQLPPPTSSSAYARNWGKIVKNLSAKYPPPEGWVNTVPEVEPSEQTCPVCRGRGVNYAQNDEPCYKCDGEGTIFEAEGMNESEPHNAGDYDFIDFADEQAYYAVADEVGDRLIFGMNNEVGIPEEYSEKVEGMLRRLGFEKGIDYNYTSRGNPGHISNRKPEVEEDLQNGYTERDFIDGEDLFPKGSHQSPSDDLGPTASGYGDNAMQNRMRSKEADKVYENMKQAYRRHRKA